MWGCGGVHGPEAAVTQQLSQTGTLKLTACLPPARSHASQRCSRSQIDVIKDVSEFIAEECTKKKTPGRDKERGGTDSEPITGEKGKARL